MLMVLILLGRVVQFVRWVYTRGGTRRSFPWTECSPHWWHHSCTSHASGCSSQCKQIWKQLMWTSLELDRFLYNSLCMFVCVRELLSSDAMKEYNRARVYLDENYKSQEHFTVSAFFFLNVLSEKCTHTHTGFGHGFYLRLCGLN